MKKLNGILPIVFILSLALSGLWNIIEIWTESEFASKCKYTFITIAIISFITGLFIAESDSRK